MFIAYMTLEEYSSGRLIEWVWELEATSYDEAVTELKRKIFEENRDENDPDDHSYLNFDEATLFEVVNKIDMPISKWYKEADQKVEEIKVQKKIEAEQKEYERLKQKFG